VTTRNLDHHRQNLRQTLGHYEMVEPTKFAAAD
jgi:hypothetical protein